MTWRAVVFALMIAVVACGATGCGRKAAPDHPPGSDYPRRYPAW